MTFNPVPHTKKFNMVKAFGDIRFRHIPCGFKPMDSDSIIYVRYKSSKEQCFDTSNSIIDVAPDYAYYSFPDREILITRHNHRIDGDRPFNTNTKQWHKAVSLSMASSVANDIPYDRFMIKPHDFSYQTELRIRDQNCFSYSDKLCFSDSGAFALGHGAISFIHPEELSEFYIRNADEGVTIDIPARALGDGEILKYTAKVQNLNTRYMKKCLPKDFQLANVVHGLNLKYIDQFRQDTEEFDADFDIVSISGTLRFNIMEAIHRLVHIIFTGQRYKQYHILGTGNPPFLAAMVYLAYKLKAMNIDVLLTADSSSPIGFSLKHTYYAQRVGYEGLLPTRFGSRMSNGNISVIGDVPNPYNSFASSDPLSQIIGGYQDIISLYTTSFTRAFLVYQNQISITRYTNQMSLFADSMDSKQYKALLQEQYRNSMHSHLLQKTIDYIDTMADIGHVEALKKFSYYMPQFSDHHNLYNFPVLEQTETMQIEKDNTKLTKKHLVNVLKGYLEFHKTGKVPRNQAKQSVKRSSNVNIKLK